MIIADSLAELLGVLLHYKNLSLAKSKAQVKLSAKHLVFASNVAMRDLLAGDMEKLRGPRTGNIFLHENDIFRFARTVYRPAYKEGAHYERWEDTPAFKERPDGSSLYERPLSRNLFARVLKAQDPIVYDYARQHEGKIPERDFAKYIKTGYYNDSCGGGGITEYFNLKPIYLVALWVENLDEKPIQLKSYQGALYYPHDGLEYREIFRGAGEKKEIPLPRISLNRGESVLIPEFVFIGELVQSGASKQFIRFCRTIEEALDFDIYESKERPIIIGPSLSIDRVLYDKTGLQIHEFNYENILRLNKYFMIGSCPFVFVEKGGETVFLKEILTDLNIEEIELSNVHKVIIAELKDETTNLTNIIITDEERGPLATGPFCLEKGEYIQIDLSQCKRLKKITICGHYRPKYENSSINIQEKLDKISVIQHFITAISERNRRYICIKDINLHLPA